MVRARHCHLGCGEIGLRVFSASLPEDSALRGRKCLASPRAGREAASVGTSFPPAPHTGGRPGAMGRRGGQGGGYWPERHIRAAAHLPGPAHTSAVITLSHGLGWLVVFILSLSMCFYLVSTRDSGAFRAHGGSDPSLYALCPLVGHSAKVRGSGGRLHHCSLDSEVSSLLSAQTGGDWVSLG